MDKEYMEDRQFQGEDFSERRLEKGEYDHCRFSGCNFYNANLSGILFSECVFEDCDLSMAKLNDSAFRDVKFKNSKMLGLRFDDCNGFSFSVVFESCILNFSSFYRLKLKNTPFRDCKLLETEFVEADLTNAVFDECDLSGALFEKTTLEGADFRTAYHFSIDPELNRIAKAKFSSQNIAGLLHKYNIRIS